MMEGRNKYIADGVWFVSRAVPLIRPDASDREVIDATLFAALGVEKLLKGVLWEVNPVFVLKEQDFKNAVPVLYADRVVPSERPDSELASRPKPDVLSMRTTILRVKVFSPATAAHKGVLFALADYRDTIAHRSIGELDMEKVKETLVRDVYPFLDAVALDLNLPVERLAGGHALRLAGLVAERHSDVETRVRMTLAVHRAKWEKARLLPGCEEEAVLRTERALSEKDRHPVECPACQNRAVLTTESEYEVVDGELENLGGVADSLYCFYCELTLDDHIDLDQLGFFQELYF